MNRKDQLFRKKTSVTEVLTPYVRQWLADEKRKLDIIALRPSFIDLCDGDLFAAVIFSQMFYWHCDSKSGEGTRLKVQRDGYMWLAKTYKDWSDECRVKEPTARKKIARLRAIGLSED